MVIQYGPIIAVRPNAGISCTVLYRSCRNKTIVFQNKSEKILFLHSQYCRPFGRGSGIFVGADRMARLCVCRFSVKLCVDV